MAGNIMSEGRYWAQVARGEEDECWPWMGLKRAKGYGSVGWRALTGKPNERAHRVAWIITRGAIPEGQFVLHRCDNPPCCNPNHLFLGNNDQNMEDMTRKGRRVRGKAVGTAKLNENDVKTIKWAYKSGIMNQKELGWLYEVHSTSICLMVNDKSWRHVTS